MPVKKRYLLGMKEKVTLSRVTPGRADWALLVPRRMEIEHTL